MAGREYQVQLTAVVSRLNSDVNASQYKLHLRVDDCSTCLGAIFRQSVTDPSNTTLTTSSRPADSADRTRPFRATRKGFRCAT